MGIMKDMKEGLLSAALMMVMALMGAPAQSAWALTAQSQTESGALAKAQSAQTQSPGTPPAQPSQAQLRPATVQDHIDLAATHLGTDYGQALSHALDAVALADEQRDLHEQIKAYRFIGAVTMNMGLTDVAAQYTGRFLELAQQAGDERQIAIAYFNLGAIRLIIGQYERARELFEDSYDRLQALALEEGTELPAGQRLIILQNLGLAHMESGAYDEAMRYFQEGIALARTDESHREILANLLSSQGMSLLRQAREDGRFIVSARQSLEESIEIFAGLGNLSGEGTVYLSLGEVLELEGNRQEAEQRYLLGYTIGQRLEAPGMMQQFARALYLLYETRKDYKQSNVYRNLYEEHQQQVNAKTAQEELTRAELTADFRRLESKLSQEVGRQRIWIVGLWFGGTLLAILMGAFTLKSRQRIRMVKGEHIEAKREQMKKALNEYISASGAKDKWDEFETRFEGVYGEFHRELTRRHPDLTFNERRLCVFLRLDMSTKEITAITGQSLGAVEMGRIRLRKKLKLTHSKQGLFDYLSSL